MSLSFDPPVALIITPVTNLLLHGCIVSTREKFTCNIKGPSCILCHNRCYTLQHLLTALKIPIKSYPLLPQWVVQQNVHITSREIFCWDPHLPPNLPLEIPKVIFVLSFKNQLLKDPFLGIPNTLLRVGKGISQDHKKYTKLDQLSRYHYMYV